MPAKQKKQRQKVLLMGRAASGKTSMRQVIFQQNYSPASSQRLGATIDIDKENQTLLGNLSLAIWDCGGQQSYMDTYLTAQRESIFSNVAVLIYVFDVKSADWAQDVTYFESILDGIQEFSASSEPSSPAEAGDEQSLDARDVGGRAGQNGKGRREAPAVFVLINKMDLEEEDMREEIEREKGKDLLERVRARLPGIAMTFGTSIWDDSLYKAWSTIIRSLVPNSHLLTAHLTRLRSRSHATEAVLFEASTFLVVAASRPLPPRYRLPHPSRKGKFVLARREEKVPEDWGAGGDGAADWTGEMEEGKGKGPVETDVGGTNRYEAVSAMIKDFRITCSRNFQGSELLGWRSDTRNYHLCIEKITPSTFVLLLGHLRDARSDYFLKHIQVARPHFEEIHTGIVTIPCPICKTIPTLQYNAVDPPAAPSSKSVGSSKTPSEAATEKVGDTA